jgi:two-component system, OmpR family, response regulator MprA
LTLDPATREVWRGDRPVDLTTKEYELLEFFMRYPRPRLSDGFVLGMGDRLG